MGQVGLSSCRQLVSSVETDEGVVVDGNCRSSLDLTRREKKLVKFEQRREKCCRIGAKESQMLPDLSGGEPNTAGFE